MPQSFSLRPARQEDAADLAELLRELDWFANLRDLGDQGAREHVARHLSLCLAGPDHLMLVAQDGQGRAIGYASVHWLPYLFKSGPEAYLSELFVRAAWRGQGVGGALLAALEAEARARGCSQLMLINNQERDSYRRGFYAKHGWGERANMANFSRPL